ncbi:MAG TPA: GNAT family N-acetyltransferase [Dehalococcoidia bacterium]|nr:GNAT family N-acetyltransferase [Dehalococcoidia bacterium]
MAQAPSFTRTYPWTTNLGGVHLTFRLMTPDDGPAVEVFAKALPHDDLTFLRTDITQPETIKAWMNYLRAGRTISILAETNDHIIGGYSSIHVNEAQWMRHVGELRVLVGSEYRGIGLGKRLTNEAFSMAKDLGLKKITAQMSTDQRGARQVFEHLGFRPEALLADHVMTRDGQLHDLLIMSYDVAGFSNDAPLRRR